MTKTITKPIFLDNNSTTPRDPRILEKFQEIETNYFGNSSSNHFFGWQAQEIIDSAKIEIGNLVNSEPDNIIFTSGATEANNLVINGFFLKDRHKNNSYLTSTIEHSSILAPLYNIQSQGAEISFFPNDENGIVNIESKLKPTFVTLHYANNEIGSIQNISNLRSHYPNSYIHSDACQAVGKISIDMTKNNIDCITISAHKANGPIGIGALIFKDSNAKSKILGQIIGGNHQSNLRAGTLPTSLIGAMGETAKIAKNELNITTSHLTKLSEIFINNLKNYFTDFELIGSKIEDRLPGNLSLRLNNVIADRLMVNLASKVTFSTGSSCQQNTGQGSHVLKEIKLDETHQKQIIRIGIGKFNTEEEIILATKLIGEAANSMKNLNS